MNFKDVFKLFKPYRLTIAIMAVFSLLVSLINAATPFVNSHLIDDGLLKQNIPALMLSLLLLLILQAASLSIQYFQTRQEIQVTNDLGKNLKIKALSHGLKLRPEYLKDQGFYKTLGDALFDISNIMGIVSSNGMMIFMIICKAIGAAIGLFLLDWRLTLLITPLIPVKIIWNIQMRKKSKELGTSMMEANKDYNTWFSDIISGIIDIKLWNLHTKKTEEYGTHTDRMNESSKKLFLFNSRNNKIMQIIEFVFINLLYLPGALLIRKGELSLGNFMTFLSFSSYLLIPVDAIMDLRILLGQISPSIEGIRAFFRLEEENYGNHNDIPCGHPSLPYGNHDDIPCGYPSLPYGNHEDIQTITFQNVSVTLDGREILKDISFEAKRGEKIVILGENGCGKTTLTNLLLGLCRPSSGEIFMDDIPIQTCNIESYRKNFSVVSQDIHLFRGTVRENITISGDSSFSEDTCPAFCTDAIKKLNQQFETPVGSGGDKLSGGERQKIALLRALNHKAQILVLDEATSNYDRESENAFHRFIRENKDYGFYFIVTHRNEILSCADKILYLSHGKLIRVEQKSACP